MHFFFLFRSIVALNPALPFWKMLAFVFLPAILGCAYAANAVGKDLDIFALGTVSLNHIFTQQPKIVNNVCSYS
jgi:ABC-type Na+ efflux pump permease subunit